MRKQNVKYIPIAKYIATQKEEKKSGASFDSVIKIIGIISGATAIFAALLYLFGRYYAGGFFGAMNIPEHLVSFSLGEYSAVAWLPLVLLAVLTAIISITFPILDGLITILMNIFFFVFSKRKDMIKNKTNSLIKKNYGRISHILLTFIFVATCFLLYQGLIITSNIGKSNGKTFLLNNANITEFHSLQPLALSEGQSKFSDDYYIYSGYRFITKNDGKYYVFRDLDPETCKPNKVYIINESTVDQVIISSPENISDQCHQTVNP